MAAADEAASNLMQELRAKLLGMPKKVSHCAHAQALYKHLQTRPVGIMAYC